MKKNRPLLRLFVLVICLGLVSPAGADVSAQSRSKRGAKKSSRAKSGAKKSSRARSGRSVSKRSRGAGRSNAASPPSPAFDKIMSENRALLNESSDAELAASQIDENKLRAHVKYLADDLLEGRGPGARGGMLAAKYIASQFEALGLEPAGAEHSYFQLVQMIGSRPDPANRLVVKTGAGSSEFKFADEFVGG